MKSASFQFEVDENHARFRLDVFLAANVDGASRSFLQRLVREGNVQLNGTVCLRVSRALAPGDRVAVEMPTPPPSALEPEDIPLDILHNDEDLIVVNKPSGLVVHPAPGHPSGTLVNAVLHHCREFHCDDFPEDEEGVLRPGIVHRLDRYTSGVMVVAKHRTSFDHLSRQAREHRFDRRYLALVQGEFKEPSGRINASIGRSLRVRGRMTVTAVKSREALTRFEVLERFKQASLLSLQLETGRTHQIRVHLRFAGHPVLGDPIYGITAYKGWPLGQELVHALEALEGQALHAELLGLEHPRTGDRRTFTAPPPADFQRALDAWRAATAGPPE